MLIDVADALTNWVNEPQRLWTRTFAAVRRVHPRYVQGDDADTLYAVVAPRNRTPDLATRGRRYEVQYDVDVLFVQPCRVGEDGDEASAADVVTFSEEVIEAIEDAGTLTTASGETLVLFGASYGGSEGLFRLDMLESFGLLVPTVFTQWRIVR